MVLKREWACSVLITYFIKHLNVSRSEPIASSEKSTLSSWISRGNGVCCAARRIRSSAKSVVCYVDVMIPTIITKSGSVAGAVIHCVLLILILSQFDRIISIIVVKREQESFTGISIAATRTWITTTTTTTTTFICTLYIQLDLQYNNKKNKVKCMAAQNNHDWLTRLGSHT